MRKRFYNWLYEYAHRKYVQHCMTEIQRYIFEQMEGNDVMVTENFDLVIEVNEDTITAIESEQSVKH